MYLNQPVKIPESNGKITYRKCKDSRYVLYQTGRRYDKQRKFNLVSRVNIGMQIPARPEYMIPNENYYRYIPTGEKQMDEKEQEALDGFTFEREQAMMIRDFFEQIYYEFQFQSRRQPEVVVNEYKVRKLNRILEPLREMMKDEPAAAWLELIPMPTEETLDGGGSILRGMTYSDVMMILTQFRCLEGEYFQKMLLR